MENAAQNLPTTEIEHFMPVEYINPEKYKSITGRTFTGMLPLDQIVIEKGFNVRIPTDDLEAHIEWLARQIQEHGFDQGRPITGFFRRDGKFVPTDGHCRYEGASRANARGAQIKEIPVILESKTFNDEDRLLALLLRNEGKKLEPLEVAILFKRLQKLGWGVPTIAHNVGKSTTHVESMLALAGAPRQLREMVGGGLVSATLAVETLKKEGAAQTIETLGAALEEAKERGKNKVTEKAIKRVKEREVVVDRDFDSGGFDGGFDGGGDFDGQVIDIDAPRSMSGGGKAAAEKPLSKGGGSRDWETWGPRMETALRAILNADSQETMEHVVTQTRHVMRNFFFQYG